MRPGPGYLILITEIAMAVSVPLGYVRTDPGCPLPGSGITMACLSPWAMFPAFLGVGAALALGPAVLAAIALAGSDCHLEANGAARIVLFIALGTTGVLGSDLILVLTFPYVAQRALGVIVSLGLLISLGLDTGYLVARIFRSRRTVQGTN